MKRHLLPLIATLTTAACLVPGWNAQAQSVTALNSSTPLVKLQGTASSATCTTATVGSPQHTIEITEDSDRRFRVKGDSETTLLLINSQGKRFCVQTDSYSDGEAELTGRWTKGTYKVFVGSKSTSKPNYILSLLQLN